MACSPAWADEVGRPRPDAILLPANFEAYRDHSCRFKAAVATIAPRIEDRGIDEIYIDLTDLDEPSHPLAERIKQSVFGATGLTCSIGISPTSCCQKSARIWKNQMASRF